MSKAERTSKYVKRMSAENKERGKAYNKTKKTSRYN